MAFVNVGPVNGILLHRLRSSSFTLKFVFLDERAVAIFHLNFQQTLMKELAK